MNKFPRYKDYNSAAENEEDADKPKWTQKVTFPLKPDVYNYMKSKETSSGTAQPDEEDVSGAGKYKEVQATINFSHEQAMYMFYLAIGSFGISPSQFKKFADDIEAGNIEEPVYSTK